MIIESLHGWILGQIWVYKPLELVVTDYCERNSSRGAATYIMGVKESYMM